MDRIILNRIEKLLMILLVFLIGIFGLFFISSFSVSFEKPLSISGFLFLDNFSDVSPSDFLDERDILVYPDKVVIKVKGASISRYEPTGSMRPVLDKGVNGIRIKPETEKDIHVGDIISFKQDDYLVVHRVIKKSFDEEGVYFVTKGDNNDFSDGKIRFENIKYITVGLIY
jgi:hypothetical protein